MIDITKVENEYRKTRIERIEAILGEKFAALEEARRTVRILEEEYKKACTTHEADWVLPEMGYKCMITWQEEE